MTGNAGRFERLVDDPGIGFIGLRTVTFTAGDIAMGAIKNETTFGMIKRRRFPSFSRMALRTWRDAINGELRLMGIRVARLAIRPDAGELDQSPITRIRHISVTLVAGDLYMHPFEREVALRVVIIDLIESIHVMTELATFGRD